MAKVIEDIGTLKINLLSQAQYDAEKAGGRLEDDELYLTPSSGGGGGAFYAEYGETTFQEIQDAYDNGSAVICEVYDDTYTHSTLEIPLLTLIPNTAALFAATFPFIDTSLNVMLSVMTDDSWNVNISEASGGGGGADYVVATDVEDGWNFRVWNDSKAECWKTIRIDDMPISNQLGNLYYGGFTANLPTNFFYGTPTVTATVNYCNPSTELVFPMFYYVDDSELDGRVCSARSIATADVEIGIYAYGYKYVQNV